MQDLTVLRVDDLPLLYAQIKELCIQQTIDRVIKPHGNWSGISIGHLVTIWLCYLLSESDHRLSAVEPWILENLILFGSISGQTKLREKDFTDDRLEKALDYLSAEENWRLISNGLNEKSLEVYDLDVQKTIRLDAAPMQGHQNVRVSKLFEYGYSKHHNPKLGMLKIMLACIDNSINGFGYPLAHLTVSGSNADDGLYIPIIVECEQTLSVSNNCYRKLYVGDGKMGSKENRYYIYKETKNDYLVPLSKIQFPQKERVAQITEQSVDTYKQVYNKDKKGNQQLVAQGFEQEHELIYEEEEGKVYKWKERRVYVLSTAYAKSQQKALTEKLVETPKIIQDLLVRKQGKRVPKTRLDLEEKIAEIVSKKGLTGLLQVQIIETEHHRKIRAHKDRAERVETWSTFELVITPNESAIAAKKKLQGWQVYATTVSKEKLDFESVVWKYRYQNRVERRFDDLRNKVVPLVPIFLKKDNRVVALINVLMICLKICSVIEFKVAKKLKEQEEELADIYEGNPKRSTPTPTAKRLLKQFHGVSLVIMGTEPNEIPDIMLTKLKQTQLKIISLFGFESDIYSDLPEKINLFFSQLIISET